MTLKPSHDQQIELTSIVIRKQQVVTSQLGDELMMLDIDTGMYHGLDPIGLYIWGLLEEPVCVSDLCARLLDRYEVDQETCQQHLLDFLNQLYQQQLLSLHTQAEQ